MNCSTGSTPFCDRGTGKYSASRSCSARVNASQRFARVEVHFVAHAQQEILGRHQATMIEFRHHAHVVQPVRIGHTALEIPQPAQQMDVAQSAARSLHVRLQQVDRFAVLNALLAALGDEILGQYGATLFEHHLHLFGESRVDFDIADHETGFEQRRADLRSRSGPSAPLQPPCAGFGPGSDKRRKCLALAARQAGR